MIQSTYIATRKPNVVHKRIIAETRKALKKLIKLNLFHFIKCFDIKARFSFIEPLFMALTATADTLFAPVLRAILMHKFDISDLTLA